MKFIVCLPKQSKDNSLEFKETFSDPNLLFLKDNKFTDWTIMATETETKITTVFLYFYFNYFSQNLFRAASARILWLILAIVNILSEISPLN